MRTFGNYRPLPTADVVYKDGFWTGEAWKHNYYPGGPAAFSAGLTQKHDADWEAWCAATQENRREWLRGFDDGRAAAKNLK